jgi:hypothetical protein
LDVETFTKKLRADSEVLHNLYCSLNIIKMIKSRRLMWAGHVARMDDVIDAYKILVGKPEGKRPLGDPVVDGG